MRRNNIYLLPGRAQVDEAVVAELELLLQEARNGSLIGFVVGCVHAGTSVSTNVVGSCHRSPMVGMGLAALIVREVEKLIV